MMSMLFLDSLLHPDNGSSKIGLPWPLFLVPLEGFQQRELVVSFGRSGGRGRLLRGWQSEEFYSCKLQTSTDLRSWNSQYLSGGREITTSLQTVDHAVPVSYFRLLLARSCGIRYEDRPSRRPRRCLPTPPRHLLCGFVPKPPRKVAVLGTIVGILALLGIVFIIYALGWGYSSGH